MYEMPVGYAFGPEGLGADEVVHFVVFGNNEPYGAVLDRSQKTGHAKRKKIQVFSYVHRVHMTLKGRGLLILESIGCGIANNDVVISFRGDLKAGVARPLLDKGGYVLE